MRSSEAWKSDAWKAAGFGALAGMRSLSAPAFLERALPARRRLFGGARKARKVTRTLSVLAVGELVADKLPFVPARTAAPALTGRLAAGAYTAAALARRNKRPVAAFALLGAGAALASSFAFFKLRQLATERLRIPNVLAGLLEDGLTLFAGRRLAEALD